MKRLSILFTVSLALGACGATPEKILSTVDETDPVRRDANLDDLRSIAENSGEDNGLRCYAVKAMGRMGDPREDVVTTLGGLVQGGDSTALRAWAAWALGELGSEAGVSPLIRTLTSPVAPDVGYHALEALARLQAHVIRDGTIQGDALKALNAYSANQREAPPDVYHLLDESLSNLKYCVEVLRDESEALTIESSDARTWNNAYRAAFKLLTFMTDRNDQVAADAPTKRRLLEEAFGRLAEDKLLTHRGLAMLSAHGIGACASREAIAPIASPSLARIYLNGDDAVRLVGVWGLARLQLYAPEAKAVMRDRLLTDEQNPRIFELLADIHDGTDEHDAIQKLFNLGEQDHDG